ncbi:hypothetical protein AM1_C0377 (plasmid) [Acaryochloris marina MBIC11017]|uniref:Uncharacterized protein n=1 Tax=Acaryochloris marina (strain MBIC 11017) TaxID=329726 RepID=A8ZNA5_ACAM1|nr:hypothetical protein AM1_C0377 [Acaryochloris marina MBIC11017]
MVRIVFMTSAFDSAVQTLQESFKHGNNCSEIFKKRFHRPQT